MWKKEKLHSIFYWNVDIHKITSLLFTNSHFCEIKVKSRFRCGSPFLYVFFLSTTRLTPSWDTNFFRQFRMDSGHPSSLRWLLSRAGNSRGESVPAGPFSLECSPGWSSDVLVSVRPSDFCLLQFHKILVISRSEKYILWNARTSWSKRVRSFLICLPF